MIQEPKQAGWRFIRRGEGLTDDLQIVYHGSGRKLRVTVTGFRDGVKQLVQKYHVPGCKWCRCSRHNHHMTCKYASQENRT